MIKTALEKVSKRAWFTLGVFSIGLGGNFLFLPLVGSSVNPGTFIGAGLGAFLYYRYVAPRD